MPQKQILLKKIKGIIILYAFNGNNSQTARAFRISRTTANKYIGYYKDSNLAYNDISGLRDKDFINSILTKNKITSKPAKHYSLRNQLQTFHKKLQTENTNLKLLWKEYKQNKPFGYEYSQFVFHYHQWCKENGFKKACYNKWKIQSIPEEDMKILKKWRLSTDRRKWERSVALLELYEGCNITKISKKIEKSCRTIKKWHIVYINKGIEHLDLKRTKRVDKQTIDNIKFKKERLIKIIHELPSLHDINRTSWSLEALAQAYEKLYGETISKSTISDYVRREGFTFKKAKKVLTSPDPEYRIKLKKITNILSNLGPRKIFFSIDEFGPFAIKIRGGRAFVPKDQIRTIPQWQKSKGSLICTAALELSTNQITHFYSSKKNTDEMIKLLEILLNKYATEERIFFSWDAASWHASKKLYEKVEEVNDPEYRAKHKNPIVELVPLPISAQFLNVIESVFSGMAKAIIHNSDYQSVEECKLAIDRYFSERNQAFIKNPKRAGKKIWGKEIVKPVFREFNNCKDPNYR